LRVGSLASAPTKAPVVRFKHPNVPHKPETGKNVEVVRLPTVSILPLVTETPVAADVIVPPVCVMPLLNAIVSADAGGGQATVSSAPIAAAHNPVLMSVLSLGVSGQHSSPVECIGAEQEQRPLETLIS